ncbi:hypothetical protein JRQ81_006504 [Phrynocephalus forsythii]|uniref:Uncharacterized protein n=1 Tax=Phrynocephalus forsythii TaxID=171643 RepID=A0A9Q0XI44_9SAUR|nr:hypothetical protein JRQ81_006504 [Phrynocephalus forsythii]
MAKLTYLMNANSIKRTTTYFLPGRCVSALKAQHLLGLVAPTTAILPHARLKVRPLQTWLLSNFNPLLDNQQKKLQVTRKISHSL